MKNLLNRLYRINKSDIKNSIKITKRFLLLFILALAIGLINGLVGAGFKFCINYVTDFRNGNVWVIFLMPLAAVATYFLYKLFFQQDSKGTNLVLESVRTQEIISPAMAPLMFVSTVLSHLCGASVGCEGAALQIGGSIGQTFARAVRLDEKHRHIVTMCAMSACFSALFGTPVAAAVFVIEVISVGIMYYSALVPCVVSAITARYVAHIFEFENEIISYQAIDNYQPVMYFRVLLLAVACAVISIFFCRLLKFSVRTSNKIKNPYLRAIVLSAAAVGIIMIAGADKYAGSGISVINLAINSKADYAAFAIKLILTCICVGAGLKGGEIVPSFFIGATFGAAFGVFIGMPAGFAAAIGMLCVFCGVTNCPLATLVISVEIFGADNIVYFMLAVAVSYFMSGYYGLYSTQRIVYSKYLPEFINVRAK